MRLVYTVQNGEISQAQTGNCIAGNLLIQRFEIPPFFLPSEQSLKATSGF